METRQEQPRPKFSFERGDDVRVIGTKGDYYYVLLDDSSVGCLSTSEAE